MYLKIYMFVKIIRKYPLEERQRNLMKKNMFASKVADEEDDDNVTSLTYKQIIKLSIKLGKENEKLKRSNVELKDYIEFLENSCKFLGKN